MIIWALTGRVVDCEPLARHPRPEPRALAGDESAGGAGAARFFTSKQFPYFAGPNLTAGIYRGDRYTPNPWPADVVDAAW